MSIPDFITTTNGNEADSLIGADGTTVLLKAPGRTIAVTGSDSDSAPHLVEDSTLFTGFGSQVVAAGPVRTKLRAASTPALRLTIHAHVANSNTLYVGGSTVTADNNNTTGGLQLSPGEWVTFGIEDVSAIYIHGTAAEGCSFFYEL